MYISITTYSQTVKKEKNHPTFHSAVCPRTGDEAGAPGAPRRACEEKAGGGDQGFRDEEVAAAATLTHKAFQHGDAAFGCGGAPTNGWFGHVSGMCFSFFFFFSMWLWGLRGRLVNSVWVFRHRRRRFFL